MLIECMVRCGSVTWDVTSPLYLLKRRCDVNCAYNLFIMHNKGSYRVWCVFIMNYNTVCNALEMNNMIWYAMNVFIMHYIVSILVVCYSGKFSWWKDCSPIKIFMTLLWGYRGAARDSLKTVIRWNVEHLKTSLLYFVNTNLTPSNTLLNGVLIRLHKSYIRPLS